MGIVMSETCWTVSVRQSNKILSLIVASSWVFYLSDWRRMEPQTLNLYFDFLYYFFWKYSISEKNSTRYHNIYRSSCKVAAIFVRFQWKLILSPQRNLIKVRPVEADGQTVITKWIVPFLNLACAPKTSVGLISVWSLIFKHMQTIVILFTLDHTSLR
jgi:hypothetical protein